MLHIGIVRNWVSKGGYGFVSFPNGVSVFVHMHDLRGVIIRSHKPEFFTGMIPGLKFMDQVHLRYPNGNRPLKVGDMIIFRCDMEARGLRATVWTHLSDWLFAERVGHLCESTADLLVLKAKYSSVLALLESEYAEIDPALEETMI